MDEEWNVDFEELLDELTKTGGELPVAAPEPEACAPGKPAHKSDVPIGSGPGIVKPDKRKRPKSPAGKASMDAEKILNIVLAVISIAAGIVILVNIVTVLAFLCAVMYYLIAGSGMIGVVAAFAGAVRWRLRSRRRYWYW